jgi:hypothetical protein
VDAPALEDATGGRTADLLIDEVFRPGASALHLTKVRATAFCTSEIIVMSFGIYAIGYSILILGMAYLAHLMRIPQNYIIAIGIIMFGAGIVTGVQRTRGKDPN